MFIFIQSVPDGFYLLGQLRPCYQMGMQMTPPEKAWKRRALFQNIQTFACISLAHFPFPLPTLWRYHNCPA